MAGIKNALKRVMEHRNRGVVVAMGEIAMETIQGEPERYIIIELYNDKGRITVYDYGSDIKINKDIELNDDVILMITSNWSAEWQKMTPSQITEWERQENQPVG